MALKSNTPWGLPDAVDVIAPGIVFYSTPRHGGVQLSDERYAQLPDAFRGTEFGGNRQWFEEDCDILKVIVSFPQHFLTTWDQDARVGRDWLATLKAFGRCFPSLVSPLLAQYDVLTLTDLAHVFERAFAADLERALAAGAPSEQWL